MEEENFNEEQNKPIDNNEPSINDEAPKEEIVNEENATPNYSLEADIKDLNQSVERIKAEIGKVIIGQDDIIDKLLIAVLTGGHVLLEGVPGTAKTLLVRLLSQAVNVSFSRIQFTPDLMPADVIGTTIFNVKTSEFEFKKGPIFAQFILGDEINRATAKTQSSLLEVMAEQQVTVEGRSYAFKDPFLVVATQNPVEQEGTYSLPEAQLDRFMFKLHVAPPAVQDEVAILERFSSDFEQRITQTVDKIIEPEELLFHRKTIQKVHIEKELLQYIAELNAYTRNHPDFYLGASTRASLALMKGAKALAALKGRSYVIPEDIQALIYPVLNHRVILSHEKEIQGADIKSVVNDIIEHIKVPR